MVNTVKKRLTVAWVAEACLFPLALLPWSFRLATYHVVLKLKENIRFFFMSDSKLERVGAI